MDKKNTTIGILLLIAAFGYMFYQNANAPERVPQRTQPPATVDQSGSQSPATPAPSVTIPTPSTLRGPLSGPATLESADTRTNEQVVILENDFIEARFTNYGGALKEVVLKQFRAEIDDETPYIMNARRFAPALELSGYSEANKDAPYQVIDNGDPFSISFKKQIGEHLEIIRHYSISTETKGPAPYNIRHEIEFNNLSGQAVPTEAIALNIGTVAPQGGQDRFLLTFGAFDGEDIDFIEQSDFTGGGFLMFKSDPKPFVNEMRRVNWASIKNQFFITIITPDAPAQGYLAQPVQFPMGLDDKQPPLGITGSLQLGQIILNPNQSQTLGFDYYIGPKEHSRISKMEQDQEKAMQFGFFGVISKVFLMIMNWMYAIVNNYGVAIICLTLLIKMVLLPVNVMSIRSMKRMSKIQEPMKLIKERYPDNQQKQQMLLMEIYKLNKMNPVAGCLPMVAQIPIFFALFYMLRGAAELRFADFLWVQDLSKPDTIAYIAGLPLNIMPVVWVVTMAWQMWSMPTPSVDNAQAKMMKFMPFIFFPITYTFSSGLVLYWTVNNVFTIFQQYMINRKEDDFEVILPPSLQKALEAPKKKSRKRK